MTKQTEEWRVIPDYPNYEVSNFGNVKSWTIKSKGKLLKPGWKSDGYETITLTNSKGSKTTSVHKVVLLAFIGKRPKGLEIRHLDGNPSNNHLSNLAYGTRKENYADRVKHGTSNRGERHPMSKLTTQDIHLIRNLIGFGWGHRMIGEIMGVTGENIRKISTGKRWSHI